MNERAIAYEAAQVDRAIRDARCDPRPLMVIADSYSDDVCKMVASRARLFTDTGLVRLYTRIACRLQSLAIEHQRAHARADIHAGEN